MIILSLLATPDSEAQSTLPPGTVGVYLPRISNVVPILLPTATPLSQGVEVKSARGSTKSNSKFFHVVGEVINKTTVNAYTIKVSAKFFDAAHNLVDDASTDVYLAMVSPQQVAPFELRTSKNIGLIVRYELAVSFLDHDSTDYRMLTVLSQQVRNNAGIEVFGEMRNNSGNTVHAAALVLTFYDTAGNVIDAYAGQVDTNLDQGQATAYAISTSHNFSYARYVVQAQGYIPH